MSVPPTRPRFVATHERGPSGSRVLHELHREDALARESSSVGFYYLMNHLKQPTGTVIVPHAQAPPPAAGQAAPAPSLALPRSPTGSREP